MKEFQASPGNDFNSPRDLNGEDQYERATSG